MCIVAFMCNLTNVKKKKKKKKKNVLRNWSQVRSMHELTIRCKLRSLTQRSIDY
jgi:hypothetical protein